MRQSYLEKFQSEGNEYVKKIIHFHYKCKGKHLLYVLFCEKHPYRPNPIEQMTGKRCTCATGCAYGICKFCCNVRYLSIFRCFKLCIKDIPASTESKIQTTPQYF